MATPASDANEIAYLIKANSFSMYYNIVLLVCIVLYTLKGGAIPDTPLAVYLLGGRMKVTQAIAVYNAKVLPRSEYYLYDRLSPKEIANIRTNKNIDTGKRQTIDKPYKPKDSPYARWYRENPIKPRMSFMVRSKDSSLNCPCRVKVKESQ